MNRFFAMRPPASAFESFKRVFFRVRSNPASLGSVVAGLLALLLVAFAANFSWAVGQGLIATGDVANAVQIGDRLRALAPEVTKAEAYLQLFSRGRMPSAGALDLQLQRISGELNALEPAMVTLPPQPWGAFRRMQEDWQAIQSQANTLKRSPAVDLAVSGSLASEALGGRFASIRERSAALQQYLRMQQEAQRLKVARWQRGIRSMAWGLLSAVFLLAGFTAWFVSWIWANSVRELTWSAERLAAGDFSQRIPVPESGSLRPLAQAVNAIADAAHPAKPPTTTPASEAALEESLEQV